MNNLTFNEWLERRDPDIYSEVDWKGMAKKAALAGGIGMAGLGGLNHMIGPGDADLIQKHFPSVNIETLDKSTLSSYADAAKAMEKGDSASNNADRSMYGKPPEDGFRTDVPDTHYQNPASWQNKINFGKKPNIPQKIQF